ncbi:MAG: hypothetical protein F4107_11285 [Gemmatimonadetes bacterium]|nr:hypothetical protein [Gemmatimonadota bacterium]MYD13415.1 hypothetical protein [Gemmatimonadota bacterium]MYI66494.1 hypothetical protein [Gemmatimonadota bacterium]
MKKRALVAVLLGAACTGAGPSDSGGNELAPNWIAEPVGSEQRLSLVEELRIGRAMGGDEAELLYVVRDLDIGPGGEIYVLDINEVKVFSPAGEFLRSWGQRGEGPGDFDGTLGLAVARDTVAVTDGERVQFFDLGGRLLSSVWTGGRAAGYLASKAHSTDLGWVVEVRRRVVQLEPGPAPPTPPAEIRYLDPGTGALGEPVASYLEQPDVLQLASGQPFSRAFNRIIGHAVDRQGDVYLPRGLDYELSVYGADGGLSRIVRMEVEPVPVTDAMLEEVRRDLIALCQRNDFRRRRCERVRYVDEILPEVLAHAHPRVPVVGHILVAPDGHLLVSRRDLRELSASDEPRPFDLLSPEGRFLGRIEIPVNLRPIIVRGEYIFGSWTDEFGVSYVVKHRVDGLPDV